MSENDLSAREDARRRLSEPEGDHELHSALGWMRVDHPHLWEVLHRVHLAHDADPSEPDDWRKAEEGSQEQELLDRYEKAMGVLATALQ